MLDIIAGPDRYDNLTFQSLGRHPSNGYAAEVVDKDALKGMKLGLPWNPYWSTWGVSESNVYSYESLVLTCDQGYQFSWPAGAVRTSRETTASCRCGDI